MSALVKVQAADGLPRARLPALMVMPLILFIMPSLFIVLMGPAVVSLAGTFGG